MYRFITHDFKLDDRVEIISNNRIGTIHNIKGVFIHVKLDNNLICTYFENEIRRIN